MRLNSASTPPRRARATPAWRKRWVGPHACRQMAESKDVDAVVIATPAYFHPEHLRAVVEARKHVYLEKPVAVDVAGAKRVLEIAKQAEGHSSLDVGFQIRSAPPFVELVRRIHAGALGEIAAGEAHYYCSGPRGPAVDRAPPAMCCGCATGFRTACSPAISSWSRTSTPRHLQLGSQGPSR